MNKKVLMIGGFLLIVVVIMIVLGNLPVNNTNVKNGNIAQVYQCSDNVDNDQDELIDEKDPGCHSDGNVDNSDSYHSEDNDEDNELAKGNLRDFFSGKMGNDLVCETIYKIPEDNELKVVMYISGKRIRLDYDMKNPVPGAEGKTQKNLHMVSDGEYGYVWGDSFLGEIMQGVKTKMDDMDSEKTSADTEQEVPAGIGMIDYDMPVTDCKLWIVDEKMFEIPEGIKFIDPDRLENMTIEDLAPSGNAGIDCSFCNQLPADQIADCLSSLGC